MAGLWCTRSIPLYVVGDAMQARPNMASSTDINQDFDSAPRRLEIPDKRQVLVYWLFKQMPNTKHEKMSEEWKHKVEASVILRAISLGNKPVL
jgi:hypothetical protein